ncbi:Mitochondrial acidic protein mam33 [Pseudogymnoascus destructans]|uniref:Mitochondrial acidic protein mam33 n=2 Tax=Pseudogymnoascus destructans TaxID=655981 RepID=L8FTM6_PSED2|nr:Mitochondrial acidic protein mam33 [Pseudogymnoascus destructans]ELR03838.1 hypothetical protein GMDG_01367 [Pseudogymnoascus destructans 20631-21]OAF57546.1 Mitochondrial acidic protein mam33 [Pseudogymnoascus destructans]
MLSLRAIARSAPRAVSRLIVSAARRPAAPISIQSSWMPLRTQAAAAFSTSRMYKATAGEVDDELVAKLGSEISMEQEMKENSEVPQSVREYLKNGPFEIQDVEGSEEVVLTRTYGDESIRVSFSVADLNAIDPEADYADRAMADEEDIDQQEKELAEEEGEPEAPDSFPVRVNVIIEKASKGALAVETIAQDGQIIIDNVYYYKDAAQARAKTAELAHTRQDLYVGPPFGNLDEDLQITLERYLDERGINTALALFAPDYIDMKEQKEYLTWLANVKGFVEA